MDATRTQNAGFRSPRIGRGLAVGDYNNDGWQDFLVSNNGEDAQLFRNAGADDPTAAGNHWLAVRLIGTKSNRDGNGAALKVIAGALTSYDQAKGGMSYCSAQDPRLFFGLGKHDKVDMLEIRWPSGIVDRFQNLPADDFVIVEEGNREARAIRFKQHQK